METKHKTREQWLNAAIKLMTAKLFRPAGYEVPEKIRAAIGFTSAGRRGKRIGECWSNTASGDGTFEIFIIPSLENPSRICDILCHEMVHAVVGLEAKHGKDFKRCAEAVGLTGKMTATVAGDGFKAFWTEHGSKLGALPHRELNASSGPAKQTTRLIKVVCPDCGYTARTTSKWLDAAGAPLCPMHGEMQVA